MKIVDIARLFIIDYFEQNGSTKLSFHTLQHTMRVVQQVEIIGKNEQLTEDEMDAVLIASWFHDVGYLVQLENHEEASMQILHSFFEEHPVSDSVAAMADRCIQATKRKNAPESMPEKVIVDADVSHIGSDRFISISKKLRKERISCQNKDIPALDYWRETLCFLKNQSFYTTFASEKYSATKDENLIQVENIIQELEAKQKHNELKPKKNERLPDKGIESMFRLTASNQMRLSSIADKKANILISINSILFSVSAVVSSKTSFLDGKLTIPVFILFITSLLSLVFAILSCRPKLSSHKYSEMDIQQRKVNLLFFGNFFQISFPSYLKAVKEMMGDYDYLYTNLIKDQYYLGLSLSRKYKLLHVAYNIFMFGFILTAVVFVVSYLTML